MSESMKYPGRETLAVIGDRIIQIERSVEIPLSQIRPNPWNYTEASPRQKESIEESVSVYGQIYEIIVRSLDGGYQIIDGEQRLSALPDPCRCHIITGLTDGECKKLTIALNGDSDRSRSKLIAILKDIESEFEEDLIIALPYTESQVEGMMMEVPEEEGEGDRNHENQEGWVKRLVKYPVDAADVIEQTYQLVSQECDYPADRAIAFGTFLEFICADYLAGR